MRGWAPEKAFPCRNHGSPDAGIPPGSYLAQCPSAATSACHSFPEGRAFSGPSPQQPPQSPLLSFSPFPFFEFSLPITMALLPIAFFYSPTLYYFFLVLFFFLINFFI